MSAITSGVQARAVLLDHLAVPSGACLWNAPLRPEVDMDDPESPGIPEAPFEVIQQGPDEVPFHRNPEVDGPLHHFQMAPEIRQPVGVVHLSVGADLIRKGGTVFGDVDRWEGVIEVQAPQQVEEALRVDLPAHLGALTAAGCRARLIVVLGDRAGSADAAG